MRDVCLITSLPVAARRIQSRLIIHVPRDRLPPRLVSEAIDFRDTSLSTYGSRGSFDGQRSDVARDAGFRLYCRRCCQSAGAHPRGYKGTYTPQKLPKLDLTTDAE